MDHKGLRLFESFESKNRKKNQVIVVLKEFESTSDYNKFLEGYSINLSKLVLRNSKVTCTEIIKKRKKDYQECLIKW